MARHAQDKNMILSSQNLKAYAQGLGFSLVGIIPAAPSPTLAAYHRWLHAGYQAGMGYLARPDRIARRDDLNVILPGIASLVMVGVDYGTTMPDEILNDPRRGRIASYAWGLDYHDLMTPRLEQLAAWLQREGGFEHRAYVDTGAILERSHAQQAGLGFVGKNTMLIRPRQGSFFFLGELLLTAEFDAYDTPHRETMCGSCMRCQMACPTDAFPQPYVLDAGRCISYHTIENKGAIPMDLRAKFGNWIYGCDVCQEVCPFQRFAPAATWPDLLPSDLDRAAPWLKDALTITEAQFQAQYGGSAIPRIKHARWLRNACVAAGNSGDDSLVPHLVYLLMNGAPLVRSHAAWGLKQLRGDLTNAVIELAIRHETDAEARAEMMTLL
jgi:epoxyqueuosine reductase